MKLSDMENLIPFSNGLATNACLLCAIVHGHLAKNRLNCIAVLLDNWHDNKFQRISLLCCLQRAFTQGPNPGADAESGLHEGQPPYGFPRLKHHCAWSCSMLVWHRPTVWEQKGAPVSVCFSYLLQFLSLSHWLICIKKKKKLIKIPLPRGWHQ